MKVYVTRDDIVNGIRFDPCNCPIARAICRATDIGDDDRLSVSIFHVTKQQDGEDQEARLPNVAQSLIAEFDAAHEVEPIQFDLEWGALTRRTRLAVHRT